MRILLICDPITPPSYAPRVMATYRYLLAAGHDCVLEAGEEWHAGIISNILRLHDRQFGHRLLHTYSADRFDIILCSTYYYFPLWTARYLSRQWHIPYVVDLRDIVEQWGSSAYFSTPLPHLFGFEHILAKIYERYHIRFRNRILDHAKAIISVSPWHCEYLRQQTTTPIHLIYNGFDENELFFQAKPTTTFHISYIGRFININLRQPHLLLQAIGQLDQQGIISPKQVYLDFYAEPSMQHLVTEIATQYGSQDYIHWLPYVKRNELNKVMAQSSILIALGCPPQNGQHGILGTKVFEAIGSEKPLLLIPSDEDSLATLIKQTQIGLATNNIEEIQKFILTKYHEWETTGYTHQLIKNKNQFSRTSLAHEAEDLLYHSTLL